MIQKDARQLWEEEYARKGIPSSYRQEPTSTLFHFVSFLQKKGIQQGKALDIGCGKGRNAFYLALHGFSVTGFDLVSENVCDLNKLTKEKKISLKAICHDVSTRWPIHENEFDIAIDIFCYKHLPSLAAQKNYRECLFVALKPNGYYFLNLASDADGFYGPLLDTSPNPSLKLVLDPHSKIPSRLYNLDEISEEFKDHFCLIEAKKISSQSPMYGKTYQREVLSLIFQRLC